MIRLELQASLDQVIEIDGLLPDRTASLSQLEISSLSVLIGSRREESPWLLGMPELGKTGSSKYIPRSRQSRSLPSRSMSEVEPPQLGMVI